MDFGTIGENAPIFLIVIGLILLQLFLSRRGKPEATHREIVQSLLSEVRLNQALAETFNRRKKLKKFEVTGWQRSKSKLDFLDQSLQVALSDTFAMVEDFNRQIEESIKHKSATYSASVDVDRLKEPLAKSRQGLEQWLPSAAKKKEPPPKYPSVFDDLFGWRK